ncbi:MAG: type II secretion system F family protein [Candidatus Pacearchaeota archaeon]|jgi:flagellar protein FlaJ
MEIKGIIKKLNLNKTKLISLGVASLIGILAILFLKNNDVLYFVLGIVFIIAILPFIISVILETGTEREKEEMFLEFSRDLVENVKAGTPISKSILNIRKKDYGKLTPHVNKLANQISLGIPVQTALETFARDNANNTITRAVTIISEAEKAGGRIDDILEAVVKSVAQVEKLKKERRAAMYTLVVQGYIIFMIFIIITLVMQFKILPIATGLGDTEIGSGLSDLGFGGGSSGGKVSSDELVKPFIWLLLTQGLFVGLVIGKLSEGKIKSGLKHSFILIAISILVNTGAKLVLGGN